MTYDEAVRWLETPDRKKQKASLQDFSALLEMLGDPQEKLRFIHVTGSNGKGSICAMLAGILTASGYKTGLYTSPHLSVYNERCCVNGEMISDEKIVDCAQTVKNVTDKMDRSFGLFYKMTAMAFLYFASQNCDIVVLEVGRGGRHDCTNVVKHTELCVIGAISLEHTEVLGSTVSAIAEEKSGIFKPGAAAVLQHQSPEAESTVMKAAEKAGIPLVITETKSAKLIAYDLQGQTLHYRKRESVRVSCPGPYQMQNILTVLDAVDLLKSRGFHITEESLRKALSQISWPGRFEILGQKPWFLIDGAHNAGAVPALCKGLQTAFPEKKFIFILTLLKDRPWKSMLEDILPLAKSCITVETSDPKALHADFLAAYICDSFMVKAEPAASETEAVRIALAKAHEEDCICVFGSMYLAGTIRDIITKKMQSSRNPETSVKVQK